MKRRKFLITSGMGLIGASTFQSVSQKPVVAVNFDLVGVEDADPSSVDSILVDFGNFELIPRYVGDVDQDAVVKITLDVEGHGSVQNEVSVSLDGRVSGSDLGSALPIIKEGISSDSSLIEGSITVSVEHPSVSDSYTQSFSITGSSDSTASNDGLIGYWPLHEWSGRANDLGSDQDHGSVTGTVEKGVSGRGGLTSYSFNGEGIVSIGPDKVDSLSQFTVTAWCNVEVFNGSDSSHGLDTNVVSNADNSTWRLSDNDSFQLGYNSNGEITLYLDDDGNHEHISGDTQVGTNEWHHLAVTHDGTDAILYLDGSEEVTWNHPLPLDNDNYFKIGAGFDKDQALNGRAQEVRLYNRVLSGGEIDDLYSIGSGDRTTQSLHDGTDSGALSRWKFDTGGVREDSWGGRTVDDNSSSGTTENAVRGTANVLDGTDDYLGLGSTGISRDDSFTVNIWAYKRGSTESSTDEVIWLSDKSDNNNGRLYIEAGNSLYQLYTNSDIIRSNYSFRNGWTMHTFACDGTETEYYINGVFQGRVVDTISIPNILVGQDNNTRFFDGFVDDARIYGRRLNQVEISELYQWGTRGKDLRDVTTSNKNSLFAWWKMNETSGNTLEDSSGNNRDATSFGAGPDRTGTESTPIYDSGYIMDGSDDQIETSFSSLTTPFTLSVWFKPDIITGGQYTLFSNYNATQDDLFFNHANTDGDLRFLLDNGGDARSPDNVVKKDNWNHGVAVVANGEQVLYCNGSEVARASGPSNGSTINNGSNYHIGSRPDGAKNFDGSLSSFRIYNRGLTPQEVSYLYEQIF